MTVTRQSVAAKLAAYLRHELSLDALVDWAECAMMEADLAEADADLLGDVLARIGVADVRSFGLTWEDCGELLHRLGFATRVEVVAA